MDCINITTKEIALSVGDAAHYTADWMKISRELATMITVTPTKYRIIENGTVRPMTTEERATYDAAHPNTNARYATKTKTQIINELSKAVDPVLPVAGRTIPGIPGIPGPMGQDTIIPAIPGDSAEVLAEKAARAQRFNTGLQANQFFLLRLESNDYKAARAEMQKLLDGGVITTEDFALVDAILPLTR